MEMGSVTFVKKISAKDQVKQALGAHFDALKLVDTGIGQNQVAQNQISWSFADAALDAEIPPAVRKRGALHEVLPQTHQDGPAAAGFALALALQFLTPQRCHEPEPAKAERHQPVLLWCSQADALQEWGPLYGPGLINFGVIHFGIDPRSILHLRLKRSIDVLWAVEEALKSTAVDLIVAEVAEVSLTASRRLALLAEARQLNPILLRPQKIPPSAAWARWCLSAAPSLQPPFDPHAPGRPCWQVELARSRSVQTGHGWILEWGRFTEPLTASLSNGSSGSFSGSSNPLLQQDNKRSASDGRIKPSPYSDGRSPTVCPDPTAFSKIAAPRGQLDDNTSDDTAYRFRLVSKLAHRSTQNTFDRDGPAFPHRKTG